MLPVMPSLAVDFAMLIVTAGAVITVESAMITGWRLEQWGIRRSAHRRCNGARQVRPPSTAAAFVREINDANATEK
jgi:hypothetical protein